ncbi:tetratricopeptide repeat protein [Caldimonas tepidiphila]|uniref:tetratricopeptide repeat protein n=1 Tax=Caldimonas tepidiphila TaxID=2315841 RepID=UPI000E5A1259|nr:tetratricopeptide repeat protein [Caldimonas tepidiphila]
MSATPRSLPAIAALLCAALQAFAAQAPPEGGTRGDAPRERAAGAVAGGQEIDAALRAYAAGRLDEAREGFERLAQGGSALARYNLAMMHLRGEAPQPDRRRALRLLEASAAQGFVRSAHALGQVHELGLVDAPDLPRSVQWYALAAGQGHPDAQLELGTAYYLGRGTAPDAGAAAHWYREAARAGDMGAQYLIASMYEKGEGVARDLRLARYWYAQAAAQGDEAAPIKLRELDRRLAAPPR